MQWNKWVAKFALARVFFLHLLLRVVFFWRKKDGIRLFLHNYSQDGVSVLSARERAAMPSLQACQNCSLCTFSCVSVAEGKAPASFEPKYLMLAYGRSSHESEVFLESWLPCYECQKCTVYCPTGTPVHTMAEVIVERRKRVSFRAD